MHIIRIILFSVIILGSGWFFYDSYLGNTTEVPESTLAQPPYRESLPYFTVEQAFQHKPEFSRTAKFDQPTVFIQGNLQAAEKINAYITRMLDDEVQRFMQRNEPLTHTSSSSPFLETLSIQFEELYTHPQLISIALHISKTTSDTPVPVRETLYAVFDGLYGSQLPLKKLFAIFNESEFATTVCAVASEKLLQATRDECIRAAQDPRAVGIDPNHMHVFIHANSFSTTVSIPIDMFKDTFHPNIQLAIIEQQESMRMSAPE